MPTKQLLPAERERLKRLLKNIRLLSNNPRISPRNEFIRYYQTRICLKILGENRPNRKRVDRALGIIKDVFPFKIWRLRKLIHG